MPLGVEVMFQSMMSELREEVYEEGEADKQMVDGEVKIEVLKTKRVVECLPSFTKWSKRVWEGMPDEAVDVSQRV